MGDPFELCRFVEAQSGIWQRALAELRGGRKTSHWMWFVFPQIAGLGTSAMARRYAISSLDEARAYLRHPVLGSRLITATHAVNAVQGRDARAIFGSPDDLKFQSSMTLFATAAPAEAVFAEALARYFGGAGDAATLEALAS